jgi:hypothetical protein
MEQVINRAVRGPCTHFSSQRRVPVILDMVRDCIDHGSRDVGAFTFQLMAPVSPMAGASIIKTLHKTITFNFAGPWHASHPQPDLRHGCISISTSNFHSPFRLSLHFDLLVGGDNGQTRVLL